MWQLMHISRTTLQKLCECYLVNQWRLWVRRRSVIVSMQWRTLYAKRLRRHGWNEGSLCAVLLHLSICRRVGESAPRCRWAQRKGWEGGLGGKKRSCLANCRLWRLKRRHCHHGNRAEKSLRSGCCLALAAAAAASEVAYVWRVTSSVQHLNLEQTVVGEGEDTEGDDEESRMKKGKQVGLFEPACGGWFSIFYIAIHRSKKQASSWYTAVPS